MVRVRSSGFRLLTRPAPRCRYRSAGGMSSFTRPGRTWGVANHLADGLPPVPPCGFLRCWRGAGAFTGMAAATPREKQKMSARIISVVMRKATTSSICCAVSTVLPGMRGRHAGKAFFAVVGRHDGLRIHAAGVRRSVAGSGPADNRAPTPARLDRGRPGSVPRETDRYGTAGTDRRADQERSFFPQPGRPPPR